MAAKILSIRPGKFAVPEEMVQAGPEPSGMALAEAAPSGTAHAGAAPSGPESTPLGPSSGGVAPAGAMPDSAISDSTMSRRGTSSWQSTPFRETLPVQGVLTVREARPLPSGQPVRAAPQDPAAQDPAAQVPALRSVDADLAVDAGHAGGAGPRRRFASPSIRSAERRRWCADLLAPGMAGVVLHGAGGIGKSVLAAQIVARAVRLEPGRLTVTFSGEVSADTLLARLASTLRRHPVAASRGGARALASAGRTDLSWGHRLDLFRDHVLGQVPVLVVLDDFDDNLSVRSAKPAIEDPALAGMLANLASVPGLARLLITCRDPFELPGTGQALGVRRVGPLSPSGAARLAAALPALSLLDEPDIDQVWRLTGGHPRNMEYLDALLAGGHAGFAEVAERLAAAIGGRTGQASLRTETYAPAPGSPAAAEKVASVAGDALLGQLCARLSPPAHDLLTGASVYREPVGSHVLLLPAGQPRQAAGLTALVAECAAAGLLSADYSAELPSVFVHRWTAAELHRRLSREQRGGEVADAHRRAAEYWRWRISSWPHDRHALHEASYHLLQAGEEGQRGRSGARRGAVRRLTVLGAAALAVTMAAGVTAAATGAFSAPARTSGPATPQGSAATDPLAGRSAAVRGQAAAWVARQGSGDAIVSCDPAMCAALQAHGIPPGNLLVLRPSSADPLGSDLVMATPAVRNQFGSRLAGVYAPVIIASFGTGDMRIDVRAVAPDGAAAYRAALAADLAARRAAGSELLHNPRLGLAPAARSDLAAGQVDSRLLLMLAAVVNIEPVRVTAFTDSGPRAAHGVPLRAADLAVPAQAGSANGTATGSANSATPGAVHGPGSALQRVLTFVRAQRPPYRPARAAIVRGRTGPPLISVEFGAPSLAGLLQGRPLTSRGPG